MLSLVVTLAAVAATPFIFVLVGYKKPPGYTPPLVRRAPTAPSKIQART